MFFSSTAFSDTVQRSTNCKFVALRRFSFCFAKKRVYFYVTMSLFSSSDIRSQRLGFISIAYCVDSLDQQVFRGIIEFGRSLPIKRATSHVTFNDQKLYLAFKLLYAVIPKFELSRLQLHFGKVWWFVVNPRVIYICVSSM